MAKLTTEQRDDRLRFDFQVANQMQSLIMNVAAYRSVEDMRAHRNPITAIEEGHLAKHYLAYYNVKTLVGPDRFSWDTSVHFDLLAGGNYPLSDPVCWVVSGRFPWTPHFKKGRPICVGDVWRVARGKMLLGHLLIHVAKLLNFDEAPLVEHYGCYTPEAAAYWRQKYDRKPITPDLVYPALPDPEPSKPVTLQDIIRPITSPPIMRARSQPLTADVFKPKNELRQVMFAPSQRNDR